MRPRSLGAIAVALLAAAGPTAAQQILIDDFSEGPQSLVITSDSTTQESNADDTTTTILGDERNLVAQSTTCVPGGSLDVIAGSGTWSVIHGGCTGAGQAFWDGNNNNALAGLDATTGLGGVNLTANSQDRFTFTFAGGNGASGTMEIEVSSNATARSSATLNVPAGGGTVDVLYSSFSQDGGATSPANFAAATAIRIFSTSTNQTINLDELRTTPVELLSFTAD